MKILALETSTASGSVAVADDSCLTAIREFQSPRGRGTAIFSLLDELRPEWLGASRIAVGIGPGSYNGLRTACALAGAFQTALGIEIVTAPSPCLLDVDAPRYFAVGDARGGRVFLAEVSARRLLGDIRLLPVEEFLRFRTTLPVYRTGPLPFAESLPLAAPSASVLALLAPSLPAAEPEAVMPRYLKPPHITQPRPAPTRLASPS